MEKIYVNTKEQLKELENQSALTWEGLAVNDIDVGLTQWLTDHKVDLTNAKANIITGEFMNKSYRLTGSNAYPRDLSIVAITGIDVSTIIMARFQVGGRWFDDIVSNNAMRQRSKR